MNETMVVCRTLFENLHLLSNESLNILLATNILVSCVNMVINTLLIYAITCTRQYQNISLRLSMYMSISDLFVGCISQQMLTFFVLSANSKIDCNVQVMSQYILYLFPHITGFFVGMVALDRYIRVKYRNTYGDIMTFKRQTIGVVFIVILAILNCLVLISGIFTGNWTVAVLGIQPIDMTFVICVILLYWRAIVIMKEHEKNRNAKIKGFSKSISKLATIYMVLVIIFYPPCLLMDMILMFDETTDTTVVFWHVMSLIWVCLNSSVNAIAFFMVNRKAKLKLKELTLRCSRKANLEIPLETSSPGHSNPSKA